jgi:hypothetical protein
MNELPACTPGHMTQAGTKNDGVEFGDNHHRDCLSIYQDDDTIHICDWPAFKAAGDQHQRERGGEISVEGS